MMKSLEQVTLGLHNADKIEYMASTSPVSTTTERSFDIILFGGTGYVGKLTAKYLANSHQTASLRIGLAGRNKKQLVKLKQTLQHINPRTSSWHIIEANALNSNDMTALAESTSVIISTVGSYARFGVALIAACAQAGTDYVDLCGETLFIRQMINEYDALAKQSGARIVPACGFDSVPSDMGMWYLHNKAQEPFGEVTMIVKKLKGALSGGTIASMIEVSQAARASRSAAKLLFSPDALSFQTGVETTQDSFIANAVVLEQQEDRWLGPFFMANFNTQIVRRSQVLLDYAYGKGFSYREAMDMGTGVTAKLKAHILLLGLGAAMKTVTHPKLGRVARKFLPAPGEGPTENQLISGHFELEFIGHTESGKRITATVQAAGDPGYQVTAMMLSEAALCLLAGETTGAAGFGTPAATLGEPYLRRLHAHGMKFR